MKGAAQHILIVDDNAANRQLLLTILQAKGYTTSEASDGVEALELLAKTKVDAIVSDILMPNMDGYQLCHEVRKSREHSTTPFIFLTATYTSPSDERYALDLGADKLLKIPISPAETLKIVHEMFSNPLYQLPRSIIPIKGVEVVKRYTNGLVTKLEEKIIELHEQTEELKKLSSALDQAADSVVITNKEGVIEYVNPAFETISGYKRGFAVGRTPAILKSGRHDAAFYTRLWKTILSGKVFREEFVNKKSNGELYHEQQTISPVFDNEGMVVHFVSAGRDVTGRRRAEERLKKLEEQFLRAQRMEGIGTLAGGIAHDLNNVLTPIVLGIEMLKNRPMDEESRDMLRTLEISARRGSGIVKQVLTFARGASGERVLLHVGDLIRELHEIVRETFPKSILFKATVPPDLWSISADSTQIHQALLNLCVNARDAMPTGGTLTVAAGNTVLDGNNAGVHAQARPGPYVVLTVTDSGTGIPRELLDKVFDPFFTTKEIGKGTGLGLSSVHGIVKSHGGFIEVDSDVGRGTIFRVYLPAVTTAHEKQAERGPVEFPTGHGECVLVVDDEASIRDICRTTLELYGYTVLTATDGPDAIAQYTRRMNSIGLVLTDMIMPLMDGRATIEALFQINPDVRIIVTSGSMGREKELESSDLPICAWLPKPFTVVQLLTTVSGVLKGSIGEKVVEEHVL